MKIKNWSKFQHFKDRRPPWIKLYRDILDDIDWHQLDPLASKVLVMCWLIASEDDGNIPDVKKLAFRLRMPEKQTKECVSRLSHWLEQGDINVISERYQHDAPETETETETKREKKEQQRGTRLPVDFVLPEDWIEFCQQYRKDLNPQSVFEEFKDYWTALPAGKGTKADWTATWRNWVRRQAVPKQSFAQQAADIARVTVPGSKAPDPALVKIEQDRAKAAPMPAHIRQQINSVLRKV